MDTEEPEGTERRGRLRQAGTTAWRTAQLGVATLVVLIMYGGLAYLVYQNRIADGPFLLFTGIIVGYVLRSIRELL